MKTLMKRIGVGFLYAIGGYVISVVVGYFLVDSLSPNTHDKSVEAAMTGAFVFGPLGDLSEEDATPLIDPLRIGTMIFV